MMGKAGLVSVVLAVAAMAAHGGILEINSGEVVDLWGYHSYDSVTIHSGGTLRVPERVFDGGLFGSGEWEGGWLNLHTSGDFIIEDGGWLNANGSGYSHWDNSLLQDSWGPGAGQNQATLPPGGGGYGGEGGHIEWAGSAGQPYGSATAVDYGADNSIQMGSAGGSVGFTIQDGMLAVHAAGGAGGGGVLVSANGSAIINGTVSANGFGGTFDASLESGGGSGGQIVIDSSYVRIGDNGSLQAMGGDTVNAGAGGGGRIKMGPSATLVLERSYDSAFDVSGGTASQNNGDGYDGTITVPAALTAGLLDDFESGLVGWVGKAGEPHHGSVVVDPLAPANSVLTFSELNSGGDIFSASISGVQDAQVVLAFDYLGLAENESVVGDLGGFISLAATNSGDEGMPHVWLAGTLDTYPELSAFLVDDGQWHHYEIAFTSPWPLLRVMVEDFAISGGVSGDCYFDNITVYVPEPTTLGLLAFGGIALLRHRRTA